MPECGTANYGEIHITVEKIQEKEGFILRKLTLKVILDESKYESKTFFLKFPGFLGRVNIDCKNFQSKTYFKSKLTLAITVLK